MFIVNYINSISYRKIVSVLFWLSLFAFVLGLLAITLRGYDMFNTWSTIFVFLTTLYALNENKNLNEQ